MASHSMALRELTSLISYSARSRPSQLPIDEDGPRSSVRKDWPLSHQVASAPCPSISKMSTDGRIGASGQMWGPASRPKARSPTTVEPTGVSRRQGSKAITGTSLTRSTRALSARQSHGDASAPVPLQSDLAVELLRQEGDQLPAEACRLVDVERRRHADPGIGDPQHH
jgi:hypothetical protein